MEPEKTAEAPPDKSGQEITSQNAPMTDAQRDGQASKLVDRFSLWSGAAGLIPVPLVDISAVGGVQLEMLRRLSKIYDVPFTENIGKSVIASLAGSVIAATTGMGIFSVLKGVPLLGTTISVITMPVFSAGATYLIGKVFIQHFASGGTLLDFNAPDYREFIKAQKEKLKANLDSSPQPSPGSEQPASPKRGSQGKGASASSN
jgi:uncharacterized protein (DUF697 family)